MNLDDERPLGEEEPVVPVALRDEERLLVIFAYMGPLAFVSLAAARHDLVRWHARQGILLGSLALLTFVLLRPFHALSYKIFARPIRPADLPGPRPLGGRLADPPPV